MRPAARKLIYTGDMATKPLETIDALELRQIHGGAARAERKQNVAFAMNAMAQKGSVSNWLKGAMATKHGGYTCACGCGLPNCQ